MDVNDDPESPDAAPLDPAPVGGPAEGAGAAAASEFALRPRVSPTEAGSSPSGASGPNPAASSPVKRYLAIGVLVAILAALGFVLYVGLSDAATFFYNVDEAADQSDQLLGERFRMQGNVVEGSVTETDDGVDFVITYGGVDMPVSHTGTPPELFGPDIPVVIEGSLIDNGERFSSDEILIRHDNEYDEEHPDRINDAERDAQARGGDG